MNWAQNDDTEATRWHVIGGNGEMSVRVHTGMYLGESAAGELSFAPDDALLLLDVRDDELAFQVVAEDVGLSVPGAGVVHVHSVRPGTQVALDFLGSVLYLVNDFANTDPTGEWIQISLIGNRNRGPLSAGPHEIPGKAAGAVAVADLRAIISMRTMDVLQRAQTLAQTIGKSLASRVRVSDTVTTATFSGMKARVEGSGEFAGDVPMRGEPTATYSAGGSASRSSMPRRAEATMARPMSNCPPPPAASTPPTTSSSTGRSSPVIDSRRARR